MRRHFDDALATMDFSLAWEHGGIRHTDTLHAPRVNFWRDILPPGLCGQLADDPGRSSFAFDFQAGTVLPPHSPSLVHRLGAGTVRRDRFPGMTLEPRCGRFYPRGILRGLPGVFEENVQPFRCSEVTSELLEADLNHPLAGKPLALRVEVRDLRPKFEEHGGGCTDWLELAASGPGMQARLHGRPTDFFGGDPFARADEQEDGIFYAQPRFVQHLDRTALDGVSRLYGRLVPAGAHVLDLMGSWDSHLPAESAPGSLTVLGMNREELERNPRASERVVHDLNREPRLPFAAGRFDAAICTVSVEYLTRPFEVFAEAARVLRPGGVLAVTFSNRWFPPKAVRLWSELHEFERVGLVLEYFLESGQYGAVETVSIRGLPRPAGDRYASQFAYSDPLYAVWGFKEDR
ncbi:MAG: methyltransferase domain-containing protein [Desulfobacterales bacterium]|jgi:SAM-dependent methyltransferase|nr:methyltransferase domain-containing protein [Desulfobacterales bacterium]